MSPIRVGNHPPKHILDEHGHADFLFPSRRVVTACACDVAKSREGLVLEDGDCWLWLVLTGLFCFGSLVELEKRPR